MPLSIAKTCHVHLLTVAGGVNICTFPDSALCLPLQELSGACLLQVLSVRASGIHQHIPEGQAGVEPGDYYFLCHLSEGHNKLLACYKILFIL